jgi:hypothetical protein
MTSRAAGEDRTAFRLLTRLFIRRLIDNDLISSHADRHDSFALVYALVLSLGVFVTFFLSIPYLSALVQLPGPAALSALADRFLFIAASTSISALAALAAWDALALEARDAAILGPLPIAPRAIARAKLAAAVVFGALLAIALNAAPSVLYPAFLTVNMRGVGGVTILRLIASHATTVTMAGMFGFFGVLAIRGLLRLLLGERAFRRASSPVQSALVVGMVTALLLALAVRASDVRTWVDGAVVPPSPVRPVLWYLGANETLGGHLVAETPIVLPPLLSAAAIPIALDDLARARYRALLPKLVTLSQGAWISFPIVTLLALATFLWSNRRLPDRSAGVPPPSRLRALVRGFCERHTQDDPETQAGFFFALQTLTRSAPHRTVLAIAVAVGLTHALIVVAQSGRLETAASGVYGVAVMLELLVLGGVLHAVNVPAAPAENWTIRMAWRGDERRYLAGVKRAAMVLVLAVLALLLPLHLALLGTSVALAHSLASLLLATTALDLLFLSYRKLPFACSYVPTENPKVVWPAAVVGLLLVTYGFADVERWALHSPARALGCVAALGAAAVLVRAADRAHRRDRRPIDFDARPRQAMQRLGLLDHTGINE